MIVGSIRHPQAKILFAWELGANLGHIRPMASLARQLEGLGLAPVFAVRDLGYARLGLGDWQVPLLQAPFWPQHRRRGAHDGDGSYQDLLAAIGFADPAKLGPMVEAWRNLIDLVAPAVIIADHSPALIIAARACGIPAIAIGTAYTMPPLDYERMPPMRGDRAPLIPEARMLEAVSKAVPDLPARGGGLASLLRTDERVVFGLAELDPYGPFRREPLHLPPEPLAPYTEPPDSPSLFAYLGTEHPRLEQLVQALATVRFRVAVYLRGEAGPLAHFLRSRGITAFEEPPALHTLLPTVSHVLSAGGAFMCQAAATAGRPHLVSPLQAEAELNLTHLSRLGIGRRLQDGGDETAIRHQIEAFMTDHRAQRQCENIAGLIAARPLANGAEAVLAAIRRQLDAQARK
jgi:UDP:flavonoid glycosyltransferase YjiC (YdhE family)